MVDQTLDEDESSPDAEAFVFEEDDTINFDELSEEEARGFTKKLEEKSKRFGKGSFTISVIACAGTERIVRVDGVRRQGVAVKAYSTSSHELKSIVKKLKKLRKKFIWQNFKGPRELEDAKAFIKNPVEEQARRKIKAAETKEKRKQAPVAGARSGGGGTFFKQDYEENVYKKYVRGPPRDVREDREIQKQEEQELRQREQEQERKLREKRSRRLKQRWERLQQQQQQQQQQRQQQQQQQTKI